MADTTPAGIDQIRIVSGVVQFDQFHPATRISIPNADRGLVNDIVLSVHGSTNSYMTIAGMPFRSPQGIRVLFYSTLEAKPITLDLTEPLLSETRLILDAQNQSFIADKYQQATQAWLAYAAQLNTVYSAQDLSRDRQVAVELGSKLPLSAMMNQLGDRSAGFGGGLHLFNFLYSDVPLPGVSLKKLLDQNRTPISQLTNIAIEFRHPVPAGGISQIAGAVAFQAEVIVHNPIPEQLADLGKTILGAIQEFDKKLQTGGAIMQSLLNAQDQLLALKTVMESLESKFASAHAEIQQLQASAQNVSAKVDGLH